MGVKVTLAEARGYATRLVIQCAGAPLTAGGCTHRAELTLDDAIARFGGDVRLDDLPFRCSRCGSRVTDVRPALRFVGGGSTTEPL